MSGPTYLLVLSSTLAGCASMFLNGAEMADHDYAAESRANYAVAACKTVGDNSPTQAPEATYHLVPKDGRMALFERSPDGSGALITNQWSAADGVHYFTWVQSNGWEYVIKDGAPTAQRIAYINVQNSQAPDGTTRPTSAPAVKCDLNRS